MWDAGLWNIGIRVYEASNLKGLPKCLVRFLDGCKLVVLYLVSGFYDVFADEI